MSRSLRRGAVAALAVAIAPVLAACSAGSDAATLQVRPNVAATTVSTLKLNGVAVVEGSDGSANVTANIANTSSTDTYTLQSVSLGGKQATLSGPASIPGLTSLLLSGPGKTAANVPDAGVQAGTNVDVTFQFSNAAGKDVSVSTPALVNTATGLYASFAPSPAAPSEPALPSDTASASSSASASASATP